MKVLGAEPVSKSGRYSLGKIRKLATKHYRHRCKGSFRNAWFVYSAYIYCEVTGSIYDLNIAHNFFEVRLINDSS